ncbi:transposase [uncultured Salinicola sp.]|uniref:RNA-guided endonuclease InsQ/TnpB family protein n=1 Tax=uncultured Salinicola sp. TaxID=1193542 RepID=UPI002635CD32|nr:transposase [uncultured Salinicola sp.]
MIRSYRFRICMSERIGCAFEAAISCSNQLYNAALEERIGSWSKARNSITKFDQFRSLTQVRSDDRKIAGYAVSMLRTPLTQVDEAFKGFFRRLKRNGAKAGFPRFRSVERLRSFGFSETGGWKLKGNTLRMKGLPSVRLKMHRELAGKPVTLTIRKDGRGRWFAVIVTRLPSVFGPTAQGSVGLDLGVENVAIDSNGLSYGRICPDRSADRRHVEDALSRQKRGSRRWRQTQKRLARQRSREASARRTKHFQLASRIVESGPQVICIEKLELRNMTRSAKGTIAEPGTNVKAKSGLNRSILDTGLAQFIQILTDKAESAGRLVVTVDPKGTSQECSDCGATVTKTLGQRWHSCPCGAEYHRDHNAARNVLQRGVVVPLRQAA